MTRAGNKRSEPNMVKQKSHLANVLAGILALIAIALVVTVIVMLLV